MTIARFFDREVIVSRLKTVSGNKKAFSTTATVDTHIQEASPEARTALGIVEERAWVAYFDVDATIKEGDKLVDSYTSRQYRVREVTLKDYHFATNQHLEVLLEEFNA
jgi:hypothetical protein